MWNLDRARGGGKNTVKGFLPMLLPPYSSTLIVRITSASVLFCESSSGAEPVE